MPAQQLRVSYEDIPASELHQAKWLLLDTLCCALASRECAAVRAVVASFDELGGRAEATVLGTGERTSALNAILASGTMVRFLDPNDVQSSALAPGPRHGHNSEIYPVLLALCERGGLSGRDLLTAAWLGYELATRFTEAIPGRLLEARGWNLDTRAAFVVPVITGRLLGLDVNQIVSAVGIALSRGLVLEVMDNPAEVNSMAKNLRYPLTAHLGVTAAYLARNGLTGPAQYAPERLTDPQIGRLAELVTIEGDPGLDDVYPSVRVAIDLADGSTVQEYVAHPAGSPDNPFTDAQVEDKFRDLASAVLDLDALRAAVDAVWSIDTCADVSAFASLFVPR